MGAPLLPYPLVVCGIDELPLHAAAGISHVLSILDPERADPEHFAAFAPHRREVWRFHDIINEQDGQRRPAEADIRAILDYGEEMSGQEVGRLLVHCHMGLSRSAAAAVMLMAQRNPGREDEAFAHLTAIRPFTWPNSRMLVIADALLGRRGALSEALGRHHREMARARPDMMAYLRAGERASEVPPDEA